jgi:signal transduction histidine kinase
LLDESGLRAALDWYLEGLKQRAGLDVEFEIDEGFERPPRDRELVIFRVVQECLTNIYRHSGSKRARIRIGREGGNVVVEVNDEGRGIAAENLEKIKAKSAGLGLRGMRERVRQFAGDLAIESQDGMGTTVRVTLPLGRSN